MAEAPKVQTVAEIMAELAPATQGQQALIDTQRANLGTKYGAQKTGLEATKVEGFNQINDQATGKGMAFSGIPAHEQATYLSTKYLPALAALDQQQNDEDMGLQKESAGLYSDTYKTAFSERSSQNSNLNSWNMQQQSLEASARENQLNREASAREAAASRAAQSVADAGPTIGQYLQSAFAENYSGENTTNGWTEKVLAGNLAAAYGISRSDALSLAYKFRSTNFGN